MNTKSEFHIIVLADGTNKIYLTILIREYLKIFFKEKCFWKKYLCSRRVALSTWKAKFWPCQNGLRMTLQVPLMGSSRQLILCWPRQPRIILENKGHPGSPHSTSAEFSAHRPYELCPPCKASFKGPARKQEELPCYFLPRNERSPRFSLQWRMAGSGSESFHREEEEASLEIWVLFQTC